MCLGGQGGTGARYPRCRREDRGVAPALRVRFVEKVFVEEIDALLELDHGRSAGEEEGEE